MDVKDIRPAIAKSGGLTVMLATGEQPKVGFAVALGNRVERMVAEAELTALGIWTDEAGMVEVEFTSVLPDEANARMLGEIRGQRAIYDLAKGETIWL